ncbi:MAG: amidohydrolase family protein [Clostridia bacterium]|nr:amidohydrolase family protein [Clostridia bacterium]
MIIDFHTHTFPEKIAGAALSKLTEASGTVPFTEGTNASLAESMKRAGIDVSVVLPVATNPEKVRHINEISASLSGKGGLIHFGCLHPCCEDVEAEIKYAAALGLKGVKIHPVYQDVAIDDDRFIRILSACGEAGLAVVTHAGLDIGFPGVVKCSPKMIRRAIALAGPVTLVLAHMGGWRCWDEVAECVADTDAYIDTSFSLGRLVPTGDGRYSDEELEMLDGEEFVSIVRALGADRVLFGTDSPWSDQTKSVLDILALPLTDAEREKILWENGARLLGLGAR